MNIWHDINKDRISENEFIACIEIQKNSKNKYELDKETGRLILDRVLFTSTHYPANYGFIPKTYGGDNDPLDVLVLCQSEIMPLCLVRCKPIGVFKMIDNEMIDEKIIAVAVDDPSYNVFNNIDELPNHIIQEMEHFFKVYKELEGKTTTIQETRGPSEAKRIIKKAIKYYEEVFQN